MKTWQGELLVVSAVLGGVVFVRGAPAIEWVAAAAVLASFAHGQVSDRLSEQEGVRATQQSGPAVECWRWSRRYYVLKEILWAAVFFASGAWAALVGVALFLAYPLWRAWWRKRQAR